MLITYAIVCCGSKTVGRINDRRATGQDVAVWAPIPPPRSQDRAVNTIRCNVCRKSAQLSQVSASTVSDLLAPHLEKFSSVPVTDPDGHDRTIAQIPLSVLCRVLGRLAV